MNIHRLGRPSSRPGFTILEILIVVAIIGLTLAFISTDLFRPRPKVARDQFIDQLSAMVTDGYLASLQSGTLYRVVFDLDAKQIRLEQATQKVDSKGDPIFQEAQGEYELTSLDLPENLEIKNLYINRNDEILHGVGGKTKKVWFYLTPAGTGQEMTLNALDNNDISAQGKPAEFSLVLNPFTMQLTTYESFQKP